MEEIDKNKLQKIFRKVKHLRIPDDIAEIDFNKLFYYSWIDESERVLYTVFELDGNLEGIRWDMTRLSDGMGYYKGFCEICHKERDRGDIALVTAETKKLPPGINYRVRGNYICSDYKACNRDIADLGYLEKLFRMILIED